MNILVTGGSGFIGTHLVRELVKAKEGTFVLDRVKGRERGATYIQGDITREQDVMKACKDIDLIVHLAAQTDVGYSIKHPREDAETNIKGTELLLRHFEGRRFIYVSSAAIYGKPAELPLTEETLPGPISPYGISKLAGERYTEEIANLRGFEYVNLRLFNVYGAGQDPTNPYSGVISRFSGMAARGEPLTIYGDGRQTRDFIYIRNVIRALVLAMQVKKAKNKTMNIASGNPITINELAEIVIELTGNKSKIKHLEEREGDIKYSFADITKAKGLLGWRPEVGLREGIAEMLELNGVLG